MQMHYEREDYGFRRPSEAAYLDCTWMEKPLDLDLDREWDGASPRRLTLFRANPAVFEHVVATAGDIDLLCLDHCPLIADLSPLERLPNLRYIYILWNQRATTLWDMGRNPRLEEIVLSEFTRLRDLDGLRAAPGLQALRLCGGLDRKWKIETLAPISALTSLTMLRLLAIAPERDGFTPLHALRCLRHLNMSLNILPVEDYAKLAAALPGTECDAFTGTWTYSYGFQDKTKEEPMRTVTMTAPVGKGKREWNADAPGAEEKTRRCREAFAALVERFRQTDG